jgi:translation initiation factor IF-3
MDFGKYKYELGKKEKQTKKKQHVIQIKEIRLRPKIEKHDYEFKMRHARKFVEAGNRVKATILFRGREMAHQEFGIRILERLAQDLEDIAKIDRSITREGKNLIMYLVKK